MTCLFDADVSKFIGILLIPCHMGKKLDKRSQ